MAEQVDRSEIDNWTPEQEVELQRIAGLVADGTVQPDSLIYFGLREGPMGYVITAANDIAAQRAEQQQ
jgi:hypothetical protein